MHEKMNCVFRSAVSIRLHQSGLILNKTQEPLQFPLKASSNTVILTKEFLFYRNKPEAVEVTFAGKCLYLNSIKRRHN